MYRNLREKYDKSPANCLLDGFLVCPVCDIQHLSGPGHQLWHRLSVDELDILDWEYSQHSWPGRCLLPANFPQSTLKQCAKVGFRPSYSLDMPTESCQLCTSSREQKMCKLFTVSKDAYNCFNIESTMK